MQDIPSLHLWPWQSWPCKEVFGFQKQLPDPLPTSSPSAWKQHPVLSPATQESIFPVNLSKKETQLHTPKPRDHLVLLISTLQASGISSSHLSPSVFVMSWTLITPPLSPAVPFWLQSSSALSQPLVQWDDLVTFHVQPSKNFPSSISWSPAPFKWCLRPLPELSQPALVPAASALHFTRAAELSKMVVSGCLQRFKFWLRWNQIKNLAS